MKVEWHAIWGCADGPVARLAPYVRMVCGACAFAVCMVAPAATASGAGVIATTVLVWWLLCWPPLRLVRVTGLLGLALFLPYLLLAPLIHAANPGASWSAALAAPWIVVVRGLASLQVTAATVSTLSMSALRRGLVRLPVPGAVAAVTLQIVQQTATLLAETKRVAAAIAVRGGASRTRTAIWVLTSMSMVWLPRVVARANRVAAAMEVRGYCHRDPAETMATTSGDLLAVGAALLAVGSALALRLWGAIG